MSAPEDDLLRAVAALSPASVLRLLANVAAEGADQLPLVTVHLSSGQACSGALVRGGADRGRETVLLVDRQTGRLRYTLLDSVIAVDVHDPRLFQDLLTEGRLPLPRTGEPVTRLALQRRFASAPDFPLDIAWDAVDGSERTLDNLDRLLTALRDTVAEVQTDELGRQAWNQVGSLRVEHRDGAALAAQRTADVLLVTADLLAALPRDLAAELHREINALL